MKITKHEIIEAIKAEKVFNPHEIAEITPLISDIEVPDEAWSYRDITRIVRGWGYDSEDPIDDPTYYQRSYTIAVYRLKVSTIQNILFDYIRKKDREVHEKQRKTNKQA